MARCVLIDEDVVNEAEAAAQEIEQSINKAKRMVLDMMENCFDYLFNENDDVKKRRKEHEENALKINIAFDYISACENEAGKIAKIADMLKKER